LSDGPLRLGGANGLGVKKVGKLVGYKYDPILLNAQGEKSPVAMLLGQYPVRKKIGKRIATSDAKQKKKAVPWFIKSGGKKIGGGIKKGEGQKKTQLKGLSLLGTEITSRKGGLLVVHSGRPQRRNKKWKGSEKGGRCCRDHSPVPFKKTI